MARSCYVCAHRLRNFIDLAIYDGKSIDDLWMSMPILAEDPSPNKTEIRYHRDRNHMRPRDFIIREQAAAAAALRTVAIAPGIGVLPPELVSRPPTPFLPPRPKGIHSGVPLHKTGPGGSMRDRVLKRRQTTHGWSPEAQIALWEAQGGVCAACAKPDPTKLAVRRWIDDDGDRCQRVLGFVCIDCHAALRFLSYDPERTRKLAEVIADPPADRIPL